MQIQWGWIKGGLLLGSVFLLAVFLAKPIGVSTQFVILDGILWDMFSDDLVQVDTAQATGYSSKNVYLNKSGGKYAKNVANPLNYGFVFVLAMVAGGLLSSRLQKNRVSAEDKFAPQVFRNSPHKRRYPLVLISGVLILFGARLAGGCTSGHMMSGIMQTSLSGYLFAIGTFVVAIPVAILYYRKSN